MLALPVPTVVTMAQPLFRRPTWPPWSARAPGRAVARFSATALLTLAAGMGPAVAEGIYLRPDQNRPRGMALLFEREIAGGKQALGVYGITADPAQPGLWRIKVWEELPNDVKVRTETIQCSRTGPMRVTNDGRNLILRELNPGGAISSANRIDHLIWWATCFPPQAGKDPAGLRDLARQLGYSGNRVEREQVVPAGGL